MSGEWAIAFPVEEYMETATANAKKILEAAATEASNSNVPCDTIHVPDPDQFAAEGITKWPKHAAAT